MNKHRFNFALPIISTIALPISSIAYSANLPSAIDILNDKLQKINKLQDELNRQLDESRTKQSEIGQQRKQLEEQLATQQRQADEAIKTLKQQVKDLESLQHKKLFDPSVAPVTATMGEVTITNSCIGPSPQFMNITVPGWYVIQIRAGSYLYAGNYNNLSVGINENTSKVLICNGDATLPQNASNGYMRPAATCVKHLHAGAYILNVSGSDANQCHSSSINKIFSAEATMTLMLAD